MANYARVENGTPVEFYDLLPKSWGNVSGFDLLENEEGVLNGLGWYKVVKIPVNYDPLSERVSGYTYVLADGKVHETPVEEQFTPTPEVVQVPPSITATQIRLWLVRHNTPLASVADAINSIEDEATRTELLIRWERSPYFERGNPFINAVGSILGLDSEQIDQAFIEANGYE